MEFIYIFLISLAILFIVLIILGFFIYKKVVSRKKVRFNIILKGNGIRKKKISKNKLSSKIFIDEKYYTFDEKCLIKNNFTDDIFYYENNPNPINFNTRQREPETYNSKDLKSILDSDLIEKLFAEKKIAQMEMIMYIVIGVSVLTLLGIGISFLVPSSINSEANIELIRNVIKDVLING